MRSGPCHSAVNILRCGQPRRHGCQQGVRRALTQCCLAFKARLKRRCFRDACTQRVIPLWASRFFTFPLLTFSCLTAPHLATPNLAPRASPLHALPPHTSRPHASPPQTSPPGMQQAR